MRWERRAWPQGTWRLFQCYWDLQLLLPNNDKKIKTYLGLLICKHRITYFYLEYLLAMSIICGDIDLDQKVMTTGGNSWRCLHFWLFVLRSPGCQAGREQLQVSQCIKSKSAKDNRNHQALLSLVMTLLSSSRHDTTQRH